MDPGLSGPCLFQDAFQLMYLEDKYFTFTDKDLRFWRGKKRKLFSSPPWSYRTHGPLNSSTPLLPPNPLLCDYFFSLPEASQVSCCVFFFQEMTPCQHPLVMTIYGGTRWDALGNAPIRKSFIPPCFCFPLLPATRPQTHGGVFRGSLYVKLPYVYPGT